MVHLNETLFLDSSWEVGLAEAAYRRDFANIRRGENIIYFERLQNYDADAHVKWENHCFEIKTKYSKLKLHWKGKEYVEPDIAECQKETLKYPDMIKIITNFITETVNNSESEMKVLFSHDIRHENIAMMKLKAPLEIFTQLKFGQKMIDLLNIPMEKINEDFTKWKTDKEKMDVDEPETKKKKKKPKILTWAWVCRPPSTWVNEPPKEVQIRRTLVAIPEGYYSKPQTLIESINRIILYLVPSRHNISFTADEDNIVTVKVNLDDNQMRQDSRWWRLGMSESLYAILGFTKDQLTTIDSARWLLTTTVENPKTANSQQLAIKTGYTEKKAQRPIEIDRDVDTLWIYSDIVAPQIVGDRKSPLLRIIPSKGDFHGQTVVIHYDRPQYLPLAHHVISTIPVKIFNTYGLSPIPFNSPVIITLHFRKKKAQL